MKRLALLLWLALTPAALSAQQDAAARLLARADAAFEAGDSAAARAAYLELLRLDPEQSRAVFQLARLQPPGSGEQVRLLHRYTELEPQDAWGWASLGDALVDAGDEDAARAAYRRARAHAPDDADIAASLGALQPDASPRRMTLEPLVRVASDSDGSRLLRTGAAASVTIAARSRIAVDAARLTVDGTSAVSGWDAGLFGEWRPAAPFLLSARAGMISAQSETGGADVREPTLQARMRWRPQHGPALELRARHEPLTATPELLALPVVLSEARAVVELPLAGPLYARGVGRYGRLRDDVNTNTRLMWGAGPVIRLGPAFELNALVGRSSYAEPSASRYFAPERVDLIDAGFYWEREGDALVLALDAGGGIERITRFHEPAGDWARALRLWSQATWWLTPAAALRVEAEAYDTRAGEVVVAEGAWRWASLGASVVIRP